MGTASATRPGIREQHLLRKQNNPLFNDSQRTVEQDALTRARIEDGIEGDRFAEAFHIPAAAAPAQ